MADKLIVWVAGGREYPFEDRVYDSLDALIGDDGMQLAIVHGACPPRKRLVDGMYEYVGADFFASTYAQSHGFPEIRVPANWDFYDKAGGPTRNGWIATVIKPDLLLAFPGGAGTKNSITVAQAHDIPVKFGDR